MTTELLEKLFMEMGIVNADLKGNVDKKGRLCFYAREGMIN